jgi:hypothetical protein
MDNMMVDIFEASRVKVKRARKHLAELEALNRPGIVGGSNS